MKCFQSVYAKFCGAPVHCDSSYTFFNSLSFSFLNQNNHFMSEMRILL